MNEEEISMQIVNPRSAGIDIGSRSHWVAIGKGEKDYREFGVKYFGLNRTNHFGANVAISFGVNGAKC